MKHGGPRPIKQKFISAQLSCLHQGTLGHRARLIAKSCNLQVVPLSGAPWGMMDGTSPRGATLPITLPGFPHASGVDDGMHSAANRRWGRATPEAAAPLSAGRRCRCSPRAAARLHSTYRGLTERPAGLGCAKWNGCRRRLHTHARCTLQDSRASRRTSCWVYDPQSAPFAPICAARRASGCSPTRARMHSHPVMTTRQMTKRMDSH